MFFWRPQDNRERYYEMAVFPEDVWIPVAVLAPYFDMDAGALLSALRRLFSRRLLQLHGHAVRLHDLQRGYVGRVILSRGDGHEASLHARLLHSHAKAAQARGSDTARWWEDLDVGLGLGEG